MKYRLAGTFVALLIVVPMALHAQSLTGDPYAGSYGSSYQTTSMGGAYGYQNQGYTLPQNNYQLYWCNGYYSYSPCPPQYYVPTYYYYPTTYYYQPYVYYPYRDWGGYGYNFNFSYDWY